LTQPSRLTIFHSYPLLNRQSGKSGYPEARSGGLFLCRISNGGERPYFGENTARKIVTAVRAAIRVKMPAASLILAK
jgi:hypothetical protein